MLQQLSFFASYSCMRDQDLSFCLNEMGRYREAIGYLNKEVSADSPPTLWNILGYSYEQIGDTEKALLLYKESIKQGITIHGANGIIRTTCKLGRLDEAIGFYHSCHESCSTKDEPYSTKDFLHLVSKTPIAKLAIDRGESEKALRFLEPRKAYKGSALEAYLLGKAYLQKNDLDKAYSFSFISVSIWQDNQSIRKLFVQVLNRLWRGGQKSNASFFLSIAPGSLKLRGEVLEVVITY